MTSMRRILSFCTLLLIGITYSDQLMAQGGAEVTCAQRLRLARATYEAGRLHELVGQILSFGDAQSKKCFDEGFSIQEKVDALKLLTLAHIYLENPSEADNAMLQLLQTDHFYKPDVTSDPAEYLALYATFRTDPIVSFSGRFGGNLTLPTLLTVYPVSSEVNSTFKPGFSIQFGLGAEKEFFPKSKSKFLNSTELMADAMFVSRSHRMEDEELFQNTPTQILNGGTTVRAGLASYKATTTWIDLHIFAKYRLNKESKWDPYVGVGPGLSLLLQSEIDLPLTQRTRADGETLTATVTGPVINVKSAYHSLTNSVTALGGVKTKLGAIYLVFEARAQFGLVNLINDETRTIPDLVNDYGKQLNDYRQSNFMVNIGVTFPYFKPKKLSRKK
jgi:hypothetical protein